MSNRYSVKPSTIKLRKDVKRGIREVIVKSADIVLPSQVLSLNCAYPFPNKIDIFKSVHDSFIQRNTYTVKPKPTSNEDLSASYI